MIHWFKNLKDTSLVLNLIFWLFPILLLNFSPFKPLGYPLTIAVFFIICIFFLIVDFEVGKVANFIFLLITSCILLKGCLDLFFLNSDFFGWLRTWSLLQFYLFSILLLFMNFKLNKINNAGFFCALKASVLILFSFSVFQILYYNYSGDLSIFRVWGDMGYGEQSYVLKSIQSGVVRANAFYFEPSYFGLVLFAIATCLVVLRTKVVVPVIYYVLVVLAIVLSGSKSAFISIFLLMLLFLFKNSRLEGKVLFIFFGVICALFVMSAGSVGVDINESSYYRLFAPVEILTSVFDEYLFGVPLGGMEDFIYSVGVMNGSEFGQTLDNGWYLIVFYFGFFGLGVVFFIFIILVSKVLFGGVVESVVLFYFLMSPFFTGAVFSPEFFFLQFMVFYSYKVSLNYETIDRYDLL